MIEDVPNLGFRASPRMNVKLRDLAAKIVAGEPDREGRLVREAADLRRRRLR